MRHDLLLRLGRRSLVTVHVHLVTGVGDFTLALLFLFGLIFAFAFDIHAAILRHLFLFCAVLRFSFSGFDANHLGVLLHRVPVGLGCRRFALDDFLLLVDTIVLIIRLEICLRLLRWKLRGS